MSGIQLRGDVLLIETEDSVSFSGVRGGKKSLQFTGLSLEEKSFLKTLRQGVESALLTSGDLTPRMLKMLELLKTERALKSLTPQLDSQNPLVRQVDWISHYSEAPEQVQDDLSQKKILILGCGGTGSIIAEHLARAGVRKFILVDGGNVDAPDLNRQLAFLPRDLGTPKVLALFQRLRALSADIKIEMIYTFGESETMIQTWVETHRPSLVINAADSPIGLIHAWVAGACAKTKTPVLFGGVGLEEGTLGPLLVSESAMQDYAAKMLSAHQKLSANLNILKASLSFTNSLMAVMIAFEAFKFLTGLFESRVLDRPLTISLVSA